MINKKINLTKLAKQNLSKYKNGDPYPHIILDDVFDREILVKILKEFNVHNKNKKIFDNPNERKTTLNNWQDFGETSLKFIKYLNSDNFLSFLEDLTGIDNLIADNTLQGGGLHQIDYGGYLKIHADFNKHPKTNLDRRINVLIYLNKEWNEKWGGKFEMWSKDLKKCIKKISPIFNRMVIFSTTSQSYHGHPSPLKTPAKISRKSIAMYYYTEGRPKNEIIDGLKYHSTLFQKRSGKQDDRRMYFYNFVKKMTTKSLIKLLMPIKIRDIIIHKKRKK